VGLTLNWRHQLLAYDDYVNLLGDNIDNIKKNTETLIDANKEKLALTSPTSGGRSVGNVEKTSYMLLSRHQKVDQNQDTKIANRSFENVLQFIYLKTTVRNQNLIQEVRGD
jgi:hypothetical protein